MASESPVSVTARQRKRIAELEESLTDLLGLIENDIKAGSCTQVRRMAYEHGCQLIGRPLVEQSPPETEVSE